MFKLSSLKRLPIPAAAGKQADSGIAADGHKDPLNTVAPASMDVDNPVADSSAITNTTVVSENMDISAEDWKPKQRSQHELHAESYHSGSNSSIPSAASPDDALTARISVDQKHDRAMSNGSRGLEGNSDALREPATAAAAVPDTEAQQKGGATGPRDDIIETAFLKQDGGEHKKAAERPEQHATGTKHAQARRSQSRAQQPEGPSDGLFDGMSLLSHAAGVMAAGSGLLKGSLLGTMAARGGQQQAAQQDDVFHIQVRLFA